MNKVYAFLLLLILCAGARPVRAEHAITVVLQPGQYIRVQCGEYDTSDGLGPYVFREIDEGCRETVFCGNLLHTGE